MDLSGNTVLITGGTSGIGLAMAKAFLGAGSEVVICGRREVRLREAQERHPGLHVRTCDVSRLADCQALAAWAGGAFPRLNVLVNNAGIQRDLDFTRGADDLPAGESEIRVNLEAPVLLSALFVPLLQGKPGAAIVNVSSGLAVVPAARMGSTARPKQACMPSPIKFECGNRPTGGRPGHRREITPRPSQDTPPAAASARRAARPRSRGRALEDG